MKIKFIADFHTEFWPKGNIAQFNNILEMYLPSRPDDKDTVLCCSGDMGTFATYPTSYKPLLKLLSKRFRHVIVVPGNHSWYHTAGVWDNESEFWKDKKLPKNVSYLDNDTIVIDNVVFICSCLWTSLDHLDPIAEWHASKQMNDFICIKKRNYEINGVYGTVIDSSRLRPIDTVNRHYHSVGFLNDALHVFSDKKCVVITHHAPCQASVNSKYAGNLLNAAFYTELSTLMLDYGPAIWAHGHMHDSVDYMVGDTRVVCNPLGYHATEINRMFNPDLVVDL